MASRGVLSHERLLEIFGADAVVRVPGADVAHGPTRRWLAEVGLPRRAANLRLDSARELPAAAETTPEALPEAIGRMLVLGTVAGDGQAVLLDGTTGAVFAGYLDVLADGDEPEALAPDLPVLVRLMAAVTQMHGDQGEFARFAGLTGPAAAAETTEAMLGVIREHAPELLDVSHRISAHWRVAAYVSPLARVAGPGEDLALDLPHGLLAEAFDPDELHRYEDAELPDELTHEPTRRFLREHGLADTGYIMLDERARTLSDHFRRNRDTAPHPFADYFREFLLDDGETLIDSVGDLIRLGSTPNDTDLVIEGATGRLLGWFKPDGTFHPVNVDVSTMAFAQWLVHQVQTLDPVHDLLNAEASMVTELTRIVASVDPVACRPTGEEDDEGYWPELFEEGSASGLYG